MVLSKQMNETAGCAASEHVDPRVRRTRKLLQDAFRELVGEKPYAEISVQDISERATVNRATFYSHYVDKQDLADSIVKTDLRASVFGMYSQRPKFNRENLVLMAMAVFEFVAGVQARCPKGASDIHSALGTTIQDELYSMTHAWLGYNGDHSQMFPETSRETLASVISSSFYASALRWVRTGKKQPAKKVCRELAAILAIQ